LLCDSYLKYINYVNNNDHKFDYDSDRIAHRKHIIVDRIKYIGKESNNLDEVSVLSIEEDSYLEYENLNDFYSWILSLKPKDVRDNGISKMALWKVKNKIKQDKQLNPKTKIVKILLQLYKRTILNEKD